MSLGHILNCSAVVLARLEELLSVWYLQNISQLGQLQRVLGEIMAKFGVHQTQAALDAPEEMVCIAQHQCDLGGDHPAFAERLQAFDGPPKPRVFGFMQVLGIKRVSQDFDIEGSSPTSLDILRRGRKLQPTAILDKRKGVLLAPLLALEESLEGRFGPFRISRFSDNPSRVEIHPLLDRQIRPLDGLDQ